MKDYWSCKECEAPITQEWDLCEDCHSDWLGWLEQRHKEANHENEIPV